MAECVSEASLFEVAGATCELAIFEQGQVSDFGDEGVAKQPALPSSGLPENMAAQAGGLLSVHYLENVPKDVYDDIGGHRNTEWLPLAAWTSISPKSKRGMVSNIAKQCAENLPGEHDLLVNQRGGVMQAVIAYPCSPRRLVWDFVGAGLILYDMITIPLLVAFEPPGTFFTEFMDWFSLAFWTANIFASLLVGYVKDGATIMAPRMIALQYFRSWFLIDILIVVPDWAVAVASQRGAKSNAGSSTRMLGGLRLVRVVRLLRLLKLRTIVGRISDLIESEYASIFANIAQMILLLLLINHVICCTWFMVGKGSGRSSDRTWIEQYEFDESTLPQVYSAAFHWSITQFTPASMEVQPQNLGERVFAITIVVFALVGFSYVVGSITGSLTELRSISNYSTQQFWNLRRYLRQNSVPVELSIRVQKYLEHVWQSRQTKYSLESVNIVKLLSEQLFAELQWELSVPHLQPHPLFHQLSMVSKISMLRLAGTAISRKPLAQSDSLFIPGEHATHMSIVVHGRLLYSRADARGNGNEEIIDKCEHWISEPALWAEGYFHRGDLVALTESDLLQVSRDRFGEVIGLNPAAYALARTYAHNFLRWLNTQHVEAGFDICKSEDFVAVLKGFIGEIQKEQRTRARRPSATRFSWERASVST